MKMMTAYAMAPSPPRMTLAAVNGFVDTVMCSVLEYAVDGDFDTPAAQPPIEVNVELSFAIANVDARAVLLACRLP